MDIAKKTKIKLVSIALLLVLLIALQFLLSESSAFMDTYNNSIFYPLQSTRVMVLDFLPFSFGDTLYIIGGLLLLLTLLRWLYYISKFRVMKGKLGGSVLNLLITFLVVTLLFLLGWGGNYSKEPLPEYWNLPRKITRKDDSIALVKFDKLLINRINENAPLYKNLSFEEVNRLSVAWYKVYTNSKLKAHGLGTKPSMFGFFMERTGIDGYYNPFTGEGQVNKHIPAFSLPFVVCHEIAHQTGIAAEGDANLMAYAIGMVTDDPTFNYSASLNIWLYVNSRLHRFDTALAKKLESQLNPLTKTHLDTLEQLSKLYNNGAARSLSGIYDGYLKMNQQKEGLRTYGNVATTAMLWEEKYKERQVLKIP